MPCIAGRPIAYHYRSRRAGQAQLTERIKEIAATRVRYGYRRMQKQSTEAANRSKPIHTCTVCGVTDKSDRNMDFRYCTKCEPPVAYCVDHLRSHEHIRTDQP